MNPAPSLYSFYGNNENEFEQHARIKTYFNMNLKIAIDLNKREGAG